MMRVAAEVTMDAGQWVILGLCVILGLWYVVGYISNGRKVRRISQTAEIATMEELLATL